MDGFPPKTTAMTGTIINPVPATPAFAVPIKIPQSRDMIQSEFENPKEFIKSTIGCIQLTVISD